LDFFIQTLIWLDYFSKFFGKKENLLRNVSLSVKRDTLDNLCHHVIKS